MAVRTRYTELMPEAEEPRLFPWFRWLFIPAIIPAYFVVPRDHHTVLSLAFVVITAGAAIYRTQWRRRRGLPPEGHGRDVG